VIAPPLKIVNGSGARSSVGPGSLLKLRSRKVVAERSFAKEVQSRASAKAVEFRGEGILAVTKALCSRE